ncbi:MAG: hypothetical protein E6X54_05620 [Veillonella parvula]|nr:hypothetical protein [Veillonella parvula]
MGTETPYLFIVASTSLVSVVKLNDPLMGMETNLLGHLHVVLTNKPLN